MKIGIIKETKIPQDRRVAFIPQQTQFIKNHFNHQIIVQKSDTRAIKDIEYSDAGIELTDDISNCDILFGIKEVDINELIPKKHYFFFGHIAKLQVYNKPLLKRMMELDITFTDYEYLVDEFNNRVVAFGWWAGVVGVYNTMRGWGIKQKSFYLEEPRVGTTLDNMIKDLQEIKMPPIKIVITGKGRASCGAQYVLDQMGIKRIDAIDFLNEEFDFASYSVLNLEHLVKHKNQNISLDNKDFRLNPESYESNFMKYATKADILVSCHYWGKNDPIYLDTDDLKNPNLKIKVIGDVTCDILGSLKSTIRATTHDNPYYDYNILSEKEEEPFSAKSNITVMAIDNLPNALPIDTSKSFGDLLIKNVLPDLLREENSTLIDNATILKNGKITEKFSYLNEFIGEN